METALFYFLFEVKLSLHFVFFQIGEIQRPIEVPQHGLLCDILWSDPERVIYIYKKIGLMVWG